MKGATFLRACSADFRIRGLGPLLPKCEALEKELAAVLDGFYCVFEAHRGDPSWLKCARAGHPSYVGRGQCSAVCTRLTWNAQLQHAWQHVALSLLAFLQHC